MSTNIEPVVSQPIADLEADGLLGQFPEGPRLVGTQCRVCGTTMIGTRIVCSNCVSRDVERIALPTTGVLYTYTRLHVGGADGPRAIGYVDLDDGVRTLADIKVGADALVPDIRVALGTDGDEWFFAPVVAGADADADAATEVTV